MRRSILRPVAFAGALLVAVLGCQTRPDTPKVQTLACPSPAASAEPNLSLGRDRLYLSWLAPQAPPLRPLGAQAQRPGQALQYAVLQGGRWSAARTIAAGDSFFANWADFPSLVELAGGELVAHWLWKSAADPHAYDVLVSRSSDGEQWSSGIRPHRDGTATEHGFVSLAADDKGGTTLVWLDGRDYTTKEHDTGETRLMASTFTSAGCSAEQILDARVCDCCQTAAVRTARGLLVAYRDRSMDEVRDISTVRFENGTWSEPAPLAADGWKIAGCPVNGPALAADGDRVAAAWFTLAQQQPVVYLAFSRDGGATFPVRVRVDDGDPLGRTDIVLLPRGALVVWVESAPDGAAAIRARHVGNEGDLDPSFPIAATSADRASGFPRLECLGSTLYFAWTDAGEPSQVKMASLALPSSWREE